MFLRRIAYVIIGTVFGALLAWRMVGADGPTVVINELMWMGSSASSADEWIELRNLTDQPVDLSNWQLTKKSSGNEVAMLTIPTGKTLPANGYFLISNYANTNTSSVLSVVPNYVTTDVALSNSALQVKLYDQNHVLLDTADDGVGNPLAGNFDSTKKIYAAMERNPIPGDGTLGQSWHAASRGVGFQDGKTERGTPGSINSNGLPLANAGPDQNAVAGQDVNFDGSDSADSDGGTLTYAWDFGDGGTSNEGTPRHTFSSAGTFTVSLAVSDGTDTALDSLVVTVAAAELVSTTPNPSLGKEGSQTTPAMIAVAQNSCRGVRISELFPNPKGADTNEFIELENTSSAGISLAGCKLWVGTSRVFPLTIDQHIAAHGFLMLPKSMTKLTLPNAAGGSVRLVDADGTDLDQVDYPAAVEAQSWSRFGTAWGWTDHVTPGKPNQDPSPEAEAKSSKTNTNSSGSKRAKPLHVVTIPEVQELDSGDRVQIRGRVTVPVDLLGKGVTFLQWPDGGVSLQLGLHAPIVPDGKSVQLTGTVRISGGRRRVTLSSTDTVRILGVDIPADAKTMNTGDVDEGQADELVHVHGVVASLTGNHFEVDDGSGTIPVYIKSSTGIVRPKMKMGDTADVTGIVSASSTGIRILPRTKDDLRIERVLGASTATTAPTTLPTSSPHQSLWYWILAALGGLAAGAKPLWKWWKERQSSSSRA